MGRARRVVVVTGASAGVGRAAARAFAEAGDDVGLIARGRAGLEAARREVEALGVRAAVAVADVADPEQVEAAAAQIERELGPIDVWVNNAMVSVFSRATDLTPAELRRVTDVTYLGSAYGTLAALKRMRARGRGVVVQVGSALAYRSIPLQGAYCAAKHAISGFLESLRCELLHDRSPVRLTTVHLPAVNTPQFSWVKSRLPGRPQPVPPIYQPELAARAIVWASRHPRKEITLGTSTLIVLLGQKLFSALGDRYLARTGFDSQQTGEPAEPGRADNLWRPVEEDRGARGEFSARAFGWDPQYWATTHRWALAGLAAAGVLAWRGRRRA